MRAKNKVMLQVLAVLLLLCLSAALLSGCGQVEDPGENTKPSSNMTTKSTEQEKVTLRIVVEEGLNGASNNSFHTFLKKHKSEFSSTHRDVEIVIEQIPREEGREEVLKQLRAELMIGEGPDILVLPVLPIAFKYSSEYFEPLIPDVQTGIRNGLFLDISTYYDADAELDKAALNQDIMDAGLLDGARYVLPLCYDMPVAYVAKEAFAQSGVPEDIFTYGAADFLNAVAQLEDPADVGSFFRTYYNGTLSFNFFPELIDYDTGEVSVTPSDLTAYLQSWQAYRVQMGKAIDAGCETSGRTSVQMCYGSGNYQSPGIYWGINGNFASCESLLEAADNALLARSHGVELDMYPMRAVDGSVVADVTYYGAVSFGCKHPELAYEFLRNYLSAEFQQESSVLDDFGWPVRTTGSVAPKVERCGLPYSLSTEGLRIINTENAMDAEMPILSVPIDHVRFSILPEKEFGDTVADMYNFREKVAADVDFEAEAEDWIKILQNHADEG